MTGEIFHCFELSKPYCLSFLAYSLLSHMKPAAMLFTCSPPQSSSTLLVFFIVCPLVHVSVCLSSPPPPLPYRPLPPSLRDPLPTLQPRAPSPSSPDEFPMNVKQAYKAFAAVPRSLAVLEPPQVGRAVRTQPGHYNNTSMLCCLVGLVPHPPDWSRLR